MRLFAVAFVAFTMSCGAGLAQSDDDAAPAPSDAPALLDDASFDAQFQCPETLPDKDSRLAEYDRWTDWARAAHPDWTFKKRLDVRYGLLRRHACAVTLANIANSNRAPFGP